MRGAVLNRECVGGGHDDPSYITPAPRQAAATLAGRLRASFLPGRRLSAQHSSTSLGCGVKGSAARASSRHTHSPTEPHVRLPVDSPARRVRPPREAPAQEEGARACVRARARAAAAATGAHQQQGLQAEEEHIPHKRRTVRARTLPPVSKVHRQGRNAT